MQQGGGHVAAHALAQAELAHRRIQQRREVEERDQFIAGSPVALAGNAVDLAQEVERLDHGEVPPELGALPEDDADAGDVGDAVFPGHAPFHLAAAAVRHEDAGEDLDGGGLAGAVGADVGDQLPPLYGEGDAFEGGHRAVAPADQSAHGTPRAGGALSDAESLVEVFDVDKWHALAQVES